MNSSPSSPSQIPELDIVCYRWGTRYGVEYVNRLRAMIARNLTVPYRFHCLTETAEGLHPDILIHLLPENHFRGNWNKLMTFQDDFLGLNGKFVVCMDIDLVIVDNIDFLAMDPDDDFKIIRNWSRSEGVRGNSSVYRLRVGSHTSVWRRFIENPEAIIDRHHGKTRAGGDQRWMNAAIETYNYFPDGRIVSFKRNCNAKGHSLGRLGEALGLTTARFGTARIPGGAAIVAFHGSPLPPDVATSRHGRWRAAPFVLEHWHE